MRCGWHGRWARVLAPIVAAAACALPGEARAASIEAAAGQQYFEGGFASDTDSNYHAVYIELGIRRATSRLSITIPRIRLTPSGNVTMTADGPALVGAGGPGAPPYQDEPGGEREGGLGDIVVRDEVVIVRSGKGKRPYVGLILDVKLPTANHREGLGTGERDWSAGLTYLQPFGKTVQFFGEAARRFMGDPEGVDFEDRLRLAAGFGFIKGRTSYRIMAENVSPLLDEVPFFDSGGAPIGARTVSDRRVARFEVTRRSIIGESFRFGLTAGLTDASEDLGIVLEFATGGR